MAINNHEFPLGVGGPSETRAVWWESGAEADTVLLIHHGLGEHAGRFASLAGLLGDLPLHVVAYDVRGHGMDQRARGDGGTLDGMAKVLGHVIPQVLEQTKSEKVVLFGHSMGAAVLGQYLTTRTLDAHIVGGILSAPPVAVHKSAAVKFKLFFAPVLAKFFPHLTVSNSIDPNAISSVAEQVQAYKADPLIHDRVSLVLGLSLLSDAPKIPSRAGCIKVPTLMYQGSADPVVLQTGTEAFFANVGSTQKRLVILESARHECHHESPDIKEALRAALFDFLMPLCRRN